MKPTLNYLAISLTLVAITLLASCVTTTAPDGTVTKSPDRELLREAGRAIIIYSTK